jgi:ABC-type transporter Mla subunit MlaD
MITSPPIRVGILVFIAIALFVGAYMFLNVNMRNVYTITVEFDDAMGMTEGSPVRMAGVAIGSIKQVILSDDLRAEMELVINKKYTIPQGSIFVMRVGMLIGEKSIDVIPNRNTKMIIKPNSFVDGITATRLEDLVPKYDKMITALSLQTKDILEKTDSVMLNLSKASEQLAQVIGNKKMYAHIDRTFVNIENASKTLELAMRDLRGIVIANDDTVSDILNNTKQISLNFMTASKELEEYVSSNYMQNQLSGTLDSAKAASESLSRSMDSLERSLVSLEGLVTSEKMQDDIKETVSGSRKAVDETNKILTKVNDFIDSKTGSLKPKLPNTSTSIESTYNLKSESFRTNVTTSLTMKGKRFLDVGLYDIGNGNKLVLQNVKKISGTEDLRIGFYASKIGLGYDKIINNNLTGTANLYDTSSAKLDLKLGYKINDSWDLILGVDKAFNDNQLIFGARMKR